MNYYYRSIFRSLRRMFKFSALHIRFLRLFSHNFSEKGVPKKQLRSRVSISVFTSNRRFSEFGTTNEIILFS